MKRLNAKDGELTKEEISDLISFGALIRGRESPFRSEAERMKCYKKHEAELLELYSRRHPGERPALWWKGRTPKRKVIGKGAYFSSAPARVKIYPIIESSAQYLFRTKLYLPHEEAEVVRQAEEDTESQRREIAFSRALVALGHNTPFPGVKKQEPSNSRREDTFPKAV